MTPRILICGDVMLDRTLYGTVERQSPEYPGIPVVRLERETLRPGGAANVAGNVVSLGAEAVLVGVVGEDPDGVTLHGLMAAMGLSEWLISIQNRPTTVKTRVVADGKPIARLDSESCEPINGFTVTRLGGRALRTLADAAALVISDYGKSVSVPDLCGMLIRATIPLKIPVICDPAGTDPTKYRGCTLLTPNAAECEALGGVDRLLTVADAVLVTRGAEGMSLHRGYGTPLWFPAESTAPLDVCGAGDTVVAALAVELARGVPLEKACLAASVAAGIAVETEGTAAVAEADWRARLKTPMERELVKAGD